MEMVIWNDNLQTWYHKVYSRAYASVRSIMASEQTQPTGLKCRSEPTQLSLHVFCLCHSVHKETCCSFRIPKNNKHLNLLWLANEGNCNSICWRFVSLFMKLMLKHISLSQQNTQCAQCVKSTLQPGMYRGVVSGENVPVVNRWLWPS